MVPNPKKLLEMKRKADKAKKILEKEMVEIEEAGIRIKIRGDEQVMSVEIDGEENKALKKAINKAMKEVRKVQMKRMKGFMGDFGL